MSASLKLLLNRLKHIPGICYCDLMKFVEFNMRCIVLFLLVIFASSGMVFAYPDEELTYCILSVKQNPILLGTPESSIENFCDCTLKKILDDDQDVRESGYECATAYFH